MSRLLSFLSLFFILALFILVQKTYAFQTVDDANVSVIANTPYSLIYFYKDGCRFCHQFEATFNYFDEKLGSVIPLYKVDGMTNKKLSQMFKVGSFPSIRIYDTNKKKFHAYTDSDRTIDLLTEFIESNIPLKVPGFEPPVNLVYNEPQMIANSFVLSTSFYFDQYEHPLHYINSIAKDFPETTICVNNVLDNAYAEWWKSLGAPTKFPSFTIIDEKGRYRMISGDELNEKKIRQFILEASNATDWLAVGEMLWDDFEVDEDEDDWEVHDEL